MSVLSTGVWHAVAVATGTQGPQAFQPLHSLAVHCHQALEFLC